MGEKTQENPELLVDWCILKLSRGNMELESLRSFCVAQHNTRKVASAASVSLDWLLSLAWDQVVDTGWHAHGGPHNTVRFLLAPIRGDDSRVVGLIILYEMVIFGFASLSNKKWGSKAMFCLVLFIRRGLSGKLTAIGWWKLTTYVACTIKLLVCIECRRHRRWSSTADTGKPTECKRLPCMLGNLCGNHNSSGMLLQPSIERANKLARGRYLLVTSVRVRTRAVWEYYVCLLLVVVQRVFLLHVTAWRWRLSLRLLRFSFYPSIIIT